MDKVEQKTDLSHVDIRRMTRCSAVRGVVVDKG